MLNKIKIKKSKSWNEAYIQTFANTDADKNI